MKKLFTVLLLLMFATPVFASDEITLHCAYIVQFTDTYYTFDAFKLTKKGKVLNSNNKVVGYVTNFDDNPKILTVFFDNGSQVYLDKEKGLSIFTVYSEGEPVRSYGSCMRVKKK